MQVSYLRPNIIRVGLGLVSKQINNNRVGYLQYFSKQWTIGRPSNLGPILTMVLIIRLPTINGSYGGGQLGQTLKTINFQFIFSNFKIMNSLGLKTLTVF